MAIFNINDRVKVTQVSPYSEEFQAPYLGLVGVVQELDDIPCVLFDDGSIVCFLEEWLELES